MESAEQVGQAVGALMGSLSNTPCRAKTWDECTPEQRMEMMRDEVRYLRRTVTDLERMVSKLKLHQHAQDGEIMVPMKRHNDDRPLGYVYDPLK